MKPAKVYNHYIWIINTLRAYGGLTLAELSEKWQEDKMTDGNVLSRATFNRYRDAITKIFGIVIECDLETYKYFISNPNIVVLENVAAGLEYLQIIIKAIKTNHRLLLGYQKFGQEGYEKIVSPYALKLFHQRWYMLAKTQEDSMRLYALDRIQSLSPTEETFEMPADFSPQDYFAEYFGVLTDSSVPMTHVVIRAHNWTPGYLRTLPLHQSQRDDYTDFSFDLRPTSDFLGQLLSQGSGIEVLEPQELRQKMHDLIAENLRRY